MKRKLNKLMGKKCKCNCCESDHYCPCCNCNGKGIPQAPTKTKIGQVNILGVEVDLIAEKKVLNLLDGKD